MFDNFNVNLRKNKGFVTYIPYIPIPPEYGRANTHFISFAALFRDVTQRSPKTYFGCNLVNFLISYRCEITDLSLKILLEAGLPMYLGFLIHVFLHFFSIAIKLG